MDAIASKSDMRSRGRPALPIPLRVELRRLVYLEGWKRKAAAEALGIHRHTAEKHAPKKHFD